MKSYCIKLLLLLSLMISLPGTAAEKITIGVEDLDYLPYYAVEKGSYIGFARELFDRFGEDSGYQIEYRPLPVERLYHYLLKGKIDFKFPDNPEWRASLKESHDFHYSEPVAPFTDGVMVHPQSLAAEPVEKPNLGTIRGFTPWPLLKDIEEGRVTMKENNSIIGLLQQTSRKRLYGAYLNVAVAQYHMKNTFGEKSVLQLDDRLPFTRSDYRLSTLHRKDITQRFNEWMETNHDWIATLKQKWGIEQ